MKRPYFQYGYAKKFAQYMYDETSRRDKALRAVAMIKDFIPNLQDKKCLVVGSSTGIMSFVLAEHFNQLIGIDIDMDAMKVATEKYLGPNIEYLEMDALEMQFPDKHFDVVICHHTYEHVYDSSILVQEIKRVMKDDGVCYFGAPNRLMIMESHYNLPFLSWLPRFAANWTVQVFRKEPLYYERMKTYWGLKILLKDFVIHDYTLKIFREAAKYHSLDVAKQYAILKNVPDWVIRLGKSFYPDYVWMLTKKQ